jgi:L-lysine 2,3-aminomutase
MTTTELHRRQRQAAAMLRKAGIVLTKQEA